MNRSVNSIKKRRPIEKPKSDLSFAPITIKCSILNQNYTAISKNEGTSSSLAIRTQKTLKTITKISNNAHSHLDKIKPIKNQELEHQKLLEDTCPIAQQIEIAKTKERESKSIDQQKNGRRNLYRSRKEKRKAVSKPKISVNKHRYMENKKLMMYFRYQIVSLMSVLSKKEEYFNFLKRKASHNLYNPPLKNAEIQEKLQKELEGKGLCKTRKNFISVTNEQLRSLNHKPRSSLTSNMSNKKDKQKNEDDEQIEEYQNEEEEYEDYPDMQTWKRKNNVNQNAKIFIVKGGYSELRNQLANRGWVENEDVYSKHFDFKWTTKISDIDYGNLKNGQIVNHFNNNHHLTSKYGLTRRLKTLFVNYGVDVDQFYPRCYDLGDQAELENFIEDFKFTYAESLANQFLEIPQLFKGKQLLLTTIIQALEKRYQRFPQKIKNTISNTYPIITPEQWKILLQLEEKQKYLRVQTSLLKQKTTQNQQTQEKHQQQQQLLESYRDRISQIINHVNQEQDTSQIVFSANQQKITKSHNIWIAKPNFLSRGRGIKCFNGASLNAIADYCLGRDTQFVIQKYIENPLLINNRKFDIRVWVMIFDYCPARIYQYEESYLRFCIEQYNISNIHNRFIHLTNNSIQKHNKFKKQKIKESMWYIDKFIDHVGEEKWADIKWKMQNIIVWSIKSCEGAVTGKKGSMELVGFDFMVDEAYNPWLIEINMSPSMEYSTPVTQKLVKMSLKDAANLIANNYSNTNNNTNKNVSKVGSFTCIYQGDQDLPKYDAYVHK